MPETFPFHSLEAFEGCSAEKAIAKVKVGKERKSIASRKLKR
jgi:hypothetical protein